MWTDSTSQSIYIAYFAYLFNPFFVRSKLERSSTPARYHPVPLNVHFIYAPTKIIRSDVVLMRSKGSSIGARQGRNTCPTEIHVFLHEFARVSIIDRYHWPLMDELFLSIPRRPLWITVTPSLLYEATCGERLFGEILILHYLKRNFHFELINK